MLVGATTDDVQDVVRTKRRLVVNEAGESVIVAGDTEDGDGLLTLNSKAGQVAVLASVDDVAESLLSIPKQEMLGSVLMSLKWVEDSRLHLKRRRHLLRWGR